MSLAYAQLMPLPEVLTMPPGRTAQCGSRGSGLGAVLLLSTALLAACGGGGGSAASVTPPSSTAPPPVSGGGNGGGTGGTGGGGSATGTTPQWTEGVFEPASAFAGRCATSEPGNSLFEKHWLRSFHHELYLWFDEIIDQDPAEFGSVASYFNVLRTLETTPSGQPKDNPRFRFFLPTTEWQQLQQSGVSAGYGVRWVVLQPTPEPERIVVVAFTEPGSPADQMGLARGDRLLVVDGIDVLLTGDSAEIEALNAAVFSPELNSSHSFTLRRVDESEFTVSMTATAVTTRPVLEVAALPGDVGYILFNNHIGPAEQQLIDAIELLAQQGVSDLILDLRYNGGGLWSIASQLAFMVAGDAATEGRNFERMRFNAKHPTINPVTNQPLQPLPFQSTTTGLSAFPSGQPLPELGLPRLAVVTGSNTCSASEAIINGLRGIDIEVLQFGARSCGKPYGTYPSDNCGTTWFSTMFQGVNDKGFGDFFDGFSPADTAGIQGVSLPGCSVPDDFTEALGSPQEARVAAALEYLATGSCPVDSGAAGAPAGLPRAGRDSLQGEGLMPGPEVLRTKVLMP